MGGRMPGHPKSGQVVVRMPNMPFAATNLITPQRTAYPAQNVPSAARTYCSEVFRDLRPVRRGAERVELCGVDPVLADLLGAPKVANAARDRRRLLPGGVRAERLHVDADD